MALTFLYTVITSSGQKLSGKMDARSRSHAIENLRQRGDRVIDLDEATSHSNKLKLETNQKLSDQDLSDFAGDLKAILDTGASLPKALAVLSEAGGRKELVSFARDLRFQLELGGNASEVLLSSKFSGTKLLGRFLYAAEAGGQYSKMLDIASSFLKKRAVAVNEIRSALAYPIFLMIASSLALGFLSLYVTPAIVPLFQDGAVPTFLYVSAQVGNWIQSNSRIVFLCVAVLMLLFFGLVKAGLFRFLVSWMAFRLPLIRKIAWDLDVGPLCLAYGALLSAGWPAERALNLTAELSLGPAGVAFQKVSSEIRDGATLTRGFRNIKVIPKELQRAVELGEMSGTVAAAVSRTGDFYIARAQRRLRKVSEVIGPILIMSIGGAVAYVMITLLGSISSLGDSVV